MAAIERRLRRHRMRALGTRELPYLVAGLGALAATDAHAQTQIDTKLLFYKESDGRTQVLNPALFLNRDFGRTAGQLSLLLAYDTISGASPTGGYPTSDTTTSASGGSTSSSNIPRVEYRDQRKSAAFSYARHFGAHLPSVDLSYSKENDYTARSAGLSDAWTMFNGRGTLHVGLSLSRDIVAPVHQDVEYAKDTDSVALGWTWIAGERDLFDLSASLMKSTGYLADPYKIVPVGTVDSMVEIHERRPDTRSRKALVAKYGHYFPWDGALKVNYRYYWDDWSIKAHTIDVLYDQHLGDNLIVSPEVRLYTQTRAAFYGALFPVEQTYMSADYRLSAFDSYLFGLGASYRISERLSFNVVGTYQKQRGSDRVEPIQSATSTGPAPTASAADLTVSTVTVGLSWKY